MAGWMALVLLVGCSSAPKQSSAQTSKTAPAAPQVSTAISNAPAAKTKESFEEKLKVIGAVQPAPFEGEGWRLLAPAWQDVRFAGGGDMEWQGGLLLLNMGNPLTGARYTNDFPTLNFEIAFDAMRVMGSDFFCGLTIPVEDTHCTLILGGWGGSLVGISSINGMDASENQSTKFIGFDKERWYRVRVRVTKGRIEAWLDGDKIADVLTKHEEISMRPGEIEMCRPLGLATYMTLGAYREIRWRAVEEPADPPPKRL